MKTILKIMVLVAVTIVCCTACKDMDSSYKEYIVPNNGRTYPGKATNPVTYSGFNKAKITWLRGTDANVVKARIFWNNYTESVEVDIPSGVDTVSCLIEPLPEAPYSFIIHTYDAEGNKSVPVEVSCIVYGDQYLSRLLGRRIERAGYYNDGRLYIRWGAADITNGAIATELEYKDAAGNPVQLVIKPTEQVTERSSFEVGSGIRWRTVYVPDSTCLDNYTTDWLTIDHLGRAPEPMSRAGWTGTCDSQQNASNSPAQTLDGIRTTQWHSDPNRAYPHWIAFDMKTVIAVENVILTMRSANPTNTFKNFMIQGSMDGVTWTDYPPADGSQYYNFKPLAEVPQTYTLEDIPEMQYIRIYMFNSNVTASPNNRYAVLAEFEVYGYPVE